MATFQRIMRVKSGGHGNTTRKDGKTSGKKIQRETFIRICKEQNGDIRKIAIVLYGEEKGKLYANTTKNRYEQLVKEGVTLPKMQFEQLRKHTEMTPELQAKLIKSWQKHNGNSNKVAEEIGVSAQTVIGWIKKFDELFLERNIQAVMKQFECDREEAIKKMSDEEGNIKFVSGLCEKQAGSRGKKAAELDTSILSEISDITNELDSLVEEIRENEDKMAEVNELAAQL